MASAPSEPADAEDNALIAALRDIPPQAGPAVSGPWYQLREKIHVALSKLPAFTAHMSEQA